jgi:hypothetical protein
MREEASASRATGLNVEALQSVTPCLSRLQEAAQRGGRKFSKLAGDCKVETSP